MQLALLPPRCLLCDAPGRDRDLCGPCIVDLPWNTRQCPGCALPLATGERCGACLTRSPPWEEAWAPWEYRFPVDRLIAAFKYAGDRVAGRVLADLMSDVAGHSAASEPRGRLDAVVPVPLHPARQRARGFNQADLIARRIGRRLSVPVRTGLIHRRRETLPQVGLRAAERRANLRNAFRPRDAATGMSVLLVDDVLTSGATVAAATRALLAGGCSRVQVWCLARGGVHVWGRKV